MDKIAPIQLCARYLNCYGLSVPPPCVIGYYPLQK